MKVVAALFLFVAATQARPQGIVELGQQALAYITKYESDKNEIGEYTYSVETSDGQARSETRRVLNPGTDQETSVVEGFYSYIDPNGERKTVGYIADENGFRPEGEHLNESASVRKGPPQVGIPSAAISSLSGGGLGR